MAINFETKLKELIPQDRLFINEPMKNHTTFRVGGPADYYIRPDSEELEKAISLAKECGLPVTVIGAGSNLLVKDGGIRGLVIEIGKEMSELTTEEDPSGSVIIRAGAGLRLSELSRKAAECSAGGLAFAAGIPGAVGGAVAMNAGAYGGEIKDVISEARVLTEDGKILTLTKEELDLSYRHSCIFEKNYIVLSACFSLEKGDAEEIRSQMSEYTRRRIEKQPLEYPSAGSTFKRPEGYFAGKLIEDAGLRGFRVGDAQVSEKHCGFVINRGDATAQDLLDLIAQVQDKVKAQFGVELETEVRILGEDR